MSCIISNFRPHQYLQRIFQSFRCISISFAPYFSFIHRPLHSTDIPLFTFLKGVWFASHQVCIERRSCKLVRSDGIGYLIFCDTYLFLFFPSPTHCIPTVIPSNLASSHQFPLNAVFIHECHLLHWLPALPRVCLQFVL